MLKYCKHLLAGATCLTAIVLSAEIPNYYRVLSASPPALPEDKPAWQTMHSAWQPDDNDKTRGFGWSVAGPSLNPNPGYLWQTTAPQHQIRQFLGHADVRSVWLIIHALRDLDAVEVKTSDLANATGDVIPAENFLCQRVYYGEKRQNYDERNCFLVADGPWQVAKGESFFIWVSFYAPPGTPPGLYRGKFLLDGVPVPVELCVLDGEFPDGIVPWGPFMSGHYYHKTVGRYVNYAPAWQTPELLGKWVALWHSRGSESPFLYHIYADISMIDGKISIKIPFLDDMIAAMKQNGMNGPLLLDVRHLTWWCYAAAREMQKKGIDRTGASLTMRGPDSLSITVAGTKDYSEESKKLFREVITIVHDHLRDCGIPVLYLSEEEIGYHLFNGFFNTKTVGYEAFNPILLDVVGRDQVCLVDNSQGYGYAGVDRGARDKIRFRSYNNWTPEALASAKTDGDQVWLYNGGWSRHIARYMMRLGALAFHQWADSWVDPKSGIWIASAVNPDGGVTTLQLERVALAMRDLAYFRRLEQYPETADLRHALFDGISENRVEFDKTANAVTDEQIDTDRWRCVLAISEALRQRGEKPLWTPEASQAHSGAVSVFVSPLKTTENATVPILTAAFSAEPLQLDAQAKEAVWSKPDNRTTPFRWTRITESHMRAMASSQEEFERMDKPSGCSVRVACDHAGLYLLVEANHVSPTANSKCENDDPNIWSDDVFEFFLRSSSSAPEWHLMVNAAGNRTLLRNGQVVAHNPVKVFTRSPLNGTGGIAQEIFVPWNAIGLSAAPLSGDIWQFNICRNFNSWRQLSSWAQVESGFDISDGQLVFGSASAVDLPPQLRIESTQGIVFSGQEWSTALSLTGKQPMQVRLSIADGKAVGWARSLSLPAGRSRLSLATKELPAGTYQLTFTQPDGTQKQANVQVLPGPF